MKKSIGKRIGAALFSILLITLAGMLLLFVIDNILRNNYINMFHRITADIITVEELRDCVHEQNLDIRNFVFTGDEQYLKTIENHRRKMFEITQRLKANISFKPMTQQLGTIQLMLAQYSRKIDFIVLVRQDRGETAAARYLEYGDFLKKTEHEVQELVRLSLEQEKQFTTRSLQNVGLLHITCGIIFLILIAAVTFIAWRINALIVHPLRNLVAGARSIARGNFDCTITTAAHDEFEEVGNAFNQMASSLKGFFSELEQAERKYRELTNLLPQIVYETDRKGYFTYANQTCFNMTGYTPEDIKRGLHGTQVVAPEYLPKLQEGMSRVMSGETLLNREYVIMRKDGSKFPCMFFTAPIVEHGEVVGARGIVLDITELKQAAESLQKSEEKYRSIFEQSNDGIFLVDAEGRITEWNQRMAEITHLAQQDIIGRYVWDVEHAFLPPEERTPQSHDRLRQNIQQWLASGINSWGNRLVEVKIHLTDGSIKYIQDTIFPIRIQKGMVWGAIARDITAQKKTEEERARLAAAIEQADEAVVITDRHGTIQYVNPAFSKVTGYGRQEPLGRKTNILKSGRHDRGFYENLWATIERGETWRGNFINKKKDGTLYDESAAISPIRDAAGEITNYVAVKRDITHELRTETRLRQAQKMEAIGTLAGGIAHDFNNILGVILGYVELTIDQVQDRPESKDNLQQVMLAASRAKELIRQILSISRQTESAARPTAVMPIAKEIIRFMRASLPTTIEIRQQLQAQHDSVVADPIELHQVFMNLCTNAGYAMKDSGGVLEMRLQNVMINQADTFERLHLKPGEYLMITISDTGRGIPPENIDRIFEPYFTTKLPGEGTGLGLAVVHGIVLSCGGDMRVYSEVGRGTTFHVYLPLSEKENAPHEDLGKKAPGGTERILFVDDEEALVKVGTEILSKLGYSITAMTVAEEALEAFKKNPGDFDLVITDKTMPKMTGFDFAAAVKKLRPELPVILCTGFLDTHDAEKAEPSAIDTLLAKPINKLLLAQTVRALLDRGRR